MCLPTSACILQAYPVLSLCTPHARGPPPGGSRPLPSERLGPKHSHKLFSPSAMAMPLRLARERFLILNREGGVAILRYHSAPATAIWEKGIIIPLNSSPPFTPACGPVTFPVEPLHLGFASVKVLLGSHASIVVPPQSEPDDAFVVSQGIPQRDRTGSDSASVNLVRPKLRKRARSANGRPNLVWPVHRNIQCLH